MNNPMEMLKTMFGKLSPKQIAINMIKNNSNPIFSNLIQMAEKGDQQGVENFARNYFKEQGKDFDTEFNQFMKNFK